MYRGLTTNQQVGDRYIRSTTGVAAAVANNATSNGEYGGWFGHSSVSQPTLSRAKTEAVWRTGSSSTTGNTASIQDIMQLLKQGQSPRSVTANVTRSGTNALHLVGTRTNPSVQQVPPPGLNGTTDQAATAHHASQMNHSEERNPNNDEHLATNHLQSNDSQQRWPGAAEIHGADSTNLLRASGGMQQLQQRGFNYNSPASRQLAGSLQSDQIRLMKSTTTLGFAPERAEPLDEQNVRNFKSNIMTPGSHISGNRNVYHVGQVPNWRNQWNQSRPQYRPNQAAARPGPMTTSEVSHRPEPASLITSDGSSVQGTTSFNAENGRSTSWQTSGAADDVGNTVLANRMREDRTLFHPERVNSKLETVMPVGLLPVTIAKQKQGLYVNFSEENRSKFGRYGVGSAHDRKNASCPPKLVPDGLRFNGSGMAQSNGSIYSQLDHENKVIKSHLVAEIPDESFARSPRHAAVATPLLGSNSTVPKRSILKKPKVYSNDFESGIYAKRRMDLYPTRHSAGSVGCFNGLSHGHPVSGVDSFQHRRQESNQKRVTFKLDQ